MMFAEKTIAPSKTFPVSTDCLLLIGCETESPRESPVFLGFHTRLSDAQEAADIALKTDLYTCVKVLRLDRNQWVFRRYARGDGKRPIQAAAQTKAAPVKVKAVA